MTIPNSSPGILAGDLVYERAASSLASPIVAGAQDTILLSWAKDPTRGNMLLLGSQDGSSTTTVTTDG